MENNKEKIIDLAKKIMDARKNPILLLNLNGIEKPEMLKIHDLLFEKKFNSIDIILQTPGGDINAAFLITKILRKTAKKVNIIVPLYAKSAGTLICLGADQILLTDLSELCPLDTQILEQQDGGQCDYASALNGFKALEQVQMHSIETLDLATKLILSRSGMMITEAIRLASDFSGKTSGKLYAKLNPHKIGEYARALEIGEQYGIILLERYMGWDKKKAENTVKILVKQYPSHGFVIDCEELVSLGLPAVKIDGGLSKDILRLRKKLLKERQDIIELIEPENDEESPTIVEDTPNQNI